MYHTLIKRQIIRLSNDRSLIKIGKSILLKINREFEEKKEVFFLEFFGRLFQSSQNRLVVAPGVRP